MLDMGTADGTMLTPKVFKFYFYKFFELSGDTSPYPGIDPESADGKILNRSCEITGTIKQ